MSPVGGFESLVREATGRGGASGLDVVELQVMYMFLAASRQGGGA